MSEPGDRPTDAITNQTIDAAYDAECVIRLEGGGEIRCESFEANPGGTSYVRVMDPAGREIAYWNSDEWQEQGQAEEVMGAILGAARGTR